MGLDISYYRQITPAPADDEGQPIDYTNHVRLYVNDDFPGRADPVTDGVYASKESDGFGCGPYSAYNRWRDELAQFAGFMSARDVWDRNKSGPFTELISFSDCEGVIGSVVAAKLAKDFADHQEKADAKGGYWLSLYNNFRKAFEMAADGGAVQFH